MLAPFVMVSDSIIVVSPYIAEQLARDPWIGGASAKCRAATPPTDGPPSALLGVTERVQSTSRTAQHYDIVIGTFGSIYKGKASTALLDVCRHLHDRGIRALTVFIGSYMRSLDDYQSEFRATARGKGIEDHVIVTGYVEDEAELFALFEQVGVFLFLFPEGLTARRSSVIAALQSNRPVVVSAPQSPSEFDHHAGWRTVTASGAVVQIPPGADTAQICDLLLSAADRAAGVAPSFDADAWWKEAIESARALL